MEPFEAFEANMEDARSLHEHAVAFSGQHGDPRPLLRSSLVAACAALETYVADRVIGLVGQLITEKKALPPHLRNIPLTVGDWADIETRYQRRGRGIKNIVDERIRKLSSTAPNQIGVVLSTIGVSGWAKQVDGARKVRGGRTVEDLDEITERRNLIVHTADRKGRGRAALSPEDVERHLENIGSIAQALESVLAAHKV